MRHGRLHLGWLIFLTVGAAVGQAPLTLPELVAKTKPAVVTLLAYSPERAMPNLSTAFLIADDMAISARHVLAGATRADIRTVDGQTRAIAGITAEDRQRDLVIVRLRDPVRNARILLLSDKLPAEGETIIAIGCPLGLEWTVSVGIVSAVRGIVDCGPAIQHTAAVSPGSSGGPIINTEGRVVGIQSAIITASTNRIVQAGQSLNFAAPALRATELQPGELRLLADCAQEVPLGWQAPLVDNVDLSSLRFISRDDFQTAIPFFQQAVTREPTNADAWFRLGLCHDRVTNNLEAEAAYRRSIELNPEFATAHNNLGVVFLRLGRYHEAVGALRRALERDRHNPRTWGSLARAHLSLENWTEAALAAAEAIRLDPKDASAHLTYGLALVELGELDRARQALDSLTGLDATRADTLRKALAARAAP